MAGGRFEVEVPCGRTVWVSDDDPTAVEDHDYKCPDCYRLRDGAR